MYWTTDRSLNKECFVCFDAENNIVENNTYDIPMYFTKHSPMVKFDGEIFYYYCDDLDGWYKYSTQPKYWTQIDNPRKK